MKFFSRWLPLLIMAAVLVSCSAQDEGSYPDEVLRNYFSENAGANLVFAEENLGVQDQYRLYIYDYADDVETEILNMAGQNPVWNTLPMSEEEYRDFFLGCCGWPIEKSEYLSQLDLTNSSAEGYWRYIGMFHPKMKGKSFSPYNGLHTFLLIDETNNKITYIKVDT